MLSKILTLAVNIWMFIHLSMCYVSLPKVKKHKLPCCAHSFVPRKAHTNQLQSQLTARNTVIAMFLHRKKNQVEHATSSQYSDWLKHWVQLIKWGLGSSSSTLPYSWLAYTSNHAFLTINNTNITITSFTLMWPCRWLLDKNGKFWVTLGSFR